MNSTRRANDSVTTEGTEGTMMSPRNPRRIGGQLIAFAITLLVASPAPAMLNPDTVYCRALGYEYFTVQTKKGLVGICKLPNGKWVNASDFYRGLVALEWSYCATQGYQAKRDESGVVCRDCLVCVLPSGEEVRATQLMGLNYRESICGDNHCGTTENSENCAADCPSGGSDEFCDGRSDATCDPDCLAQGGADRDCPGLFVDIKPGSCPNPLNVQQKGVLPLAILGSAALDIADIDANSIRLKRAGVSGSVKPLRKSEEDVGTAQPLGSCQCSTLKGDRRPDLMLHFSAPDVIRALNLSAATGTVPLIISARLKNGTELSGQDCVVIKPTGG